MKEKRPLSNTHQLFNPMQHPEYAYEYCYAGKTGYTTEAKFNLVSYVKKGTMDIVCVVMNAESKEVEYTNTKKLADYTFKRFRMLQADKISLKLNESGGQVYSSVLENDPTAQFTVSGAATLAVPKKCDINGVTTQVKEDDISGISVGANCIGGIEYMYDGKCIGNAELIYTSAKAYSFNKPEMVDNNVQMDTGNKKSKVMAIAMIVCSFLIIMVLMWYLFIYRRPTRIARRKYRKHKTGINKRNRLKW